MGPLIARDQQRTRVVQVWSHDARHQTTPRTYVMLGAVLALAVLLRFWNLPSRGLLYWDEGKFALEGIRLHYAVGHLFGGGGPLTGKSVGTAKPLHALLIAVSYAIVGFHDYAPLLMDATASVLAVALLFFVTRRLFDPTVALVAALFLTVSKYDTIYARSALSENDATMLLLAGALLWVYGYQGDEADTARVSKLSPVLAGLVFGVAFTANYRILVPIAALVGFDVLWCLHRGGVRVAASRTFRWIAGLCVAPLLWQLIGILAESRGVGLFRGDVVEVSTTYLQEVVYQLHEGKQSTIRFQPLPYLQWYVVRDGWPLFLLSLSGIALAAGRRSFPWLAMAVPVLVLYGIYVFAPFVVPRNLSALLPFASVLAASTLVAAARRLRSAQVRLSVLLVGAVALGGYEAIAGWQLTGLRSGFARAAQYVDRHGGRALTSSEIMVFYLRSNGLLCRAPAFARNAKHLREYARWGYAYLVLDDLFTNRDATYVRSHYPRVAHFAAEANLSIGESLIRSEDGAPPDSAAPREYVDVYRIGAPGRTPIPDRASICTVDDVT